MRNVKKFILCLLGVALVSMAGAVERQKLNFNGEWRLHVGEVAEAANEDYNDTGWQQVTLPYAFNGDEAFRKDIVDLTDTICWYRWPFASSLLSLRACVRVPTST